MNSLILLVFCAIFTTALAKSIQKRYVTEEIVQISGDLAKEEVQKGTGRTNMEVVKFEYEWTIENFDLIMGTRSDRDWYINSPPVSMVTSTKIYEWFFTLQLHANTNDGVMVILNLVSPSDDLIRTEFTFTILNDDKTLSNIKRKNNGNFGKTSMSYETYLLSSNDYKYSGTFDDFLTENKSLIIHFEGRSIIPSKLSDTLFTNNDVIDPKSNLSMKAMEEILHFLYTGRATNLINLQKGLLLSSDKLELKKQYEKKMLSELNVENAAEVYKFLFLHGKSELKNKVMRFIRKNSAAVMVTKGWMSILSSSDVPMIAEIIFTFANNSPAPTNNGDFPENVEVATENFTDN